MKIVNIFDAIKDGTYKDFLNFYDGSINNINCHTKLNLLLTAMVNDNNASDKIEIIKKLIRDGIDISYLDEKYKRNALQTLYFNTFRGDIKYLEEVTEILVSAGIDINQKDIYGAIALKYAITACKNSTKDMAKIYRYLLSQGSKYCEKDNFNKSCLDYAKELLWRIEFIDLVKEYENEKQK